MALTPGQDRQLKAWLRQHFKRRGCPTCASRKWDVHTYLTFPIRQTVGTPTDMIAFAIGLNGNALPCAGLCCENCGTVVFLSLVTAGVVDKQGNALPGLPPSVQESKLDLEDREGPTAPAADLKVVPPEEPEPKGEPA